ncbi:MAG TPA: acyltransferase family protein [Rhizomicrobium sp.]|nr:acyltransferase family protein [Rhizomicrobium sp.]
MRDGGNGFAGGGGGNARASVRAEPRLAGLDGLRAVAVIAVFLFHADLTWARGGYLGVDLFFVISGFLITGILAGEKEATGRLDLKQFYWRRAKRLLPASWLMIAGAVIASAILAPDALPRLKWDALASFFYVTNWELLSVNTSYFEAMGRPPMLQHLWSLAIEEQFYIFWAPVILFGLPALGRRGLAFLAALLAAASVAWTVIKAHQLGYPGAGDPTRLYFGTDTHGFPLLIGATLGLLWQPNRQPASTNHADGEGVFVIGLLALAASLLLFARMGEATPWLYPWGFLLSAAASIALIAAATWRGSFLGRWLDTQPMRWIGERSYGMYLWHWPIFMLTRPGIDIRSLDDSTILLIRAVLTVGISALSYRYIEAPIRHGALERIWAGMRNPATQRRAMRHGMSVGLSLLLAFGTVTTILVRAPSQATPADDVKEALGLNAAASTTPAPEPVSAPADVVPVAAPPIVTPAGEVPVETFTGKDLIGVGDSVLLGSSILLKATLKGTQVYATMGWQSSDVLKQIETLKKNEQLTPVVLVHLGTNGEIGEGPLRKILSLLADCKRVILVNTHVPRRWMEENNALIDRVLPDYPNTVLVNWRDVSDGQPDYFVSDGVHLTDIGQRAFIAEIMRVGHLVPGDVTGPSSEVVDPTKTYGSGSGDLSPTLVRNEQTAAPDSFWMKMARCETGSNWQNGGHYSGGLGIYIGSWKAWGGTDFAPIPAQATQEQQIEIANRISTQGYTRPDGKRVAPVGFSGWRCLSTVGHPPASSRYTYTPDSVIAQTFHLGERGDVVRDLELTLGLPRDGIYGKHVRLKHLAYLREKGLPETLAGSSS